MKIAIINSAQETIYPISHNTIGYWSQQVARQLGNSAEITLVGRRTGDERRQALRENGVNYRFIRSGFSYGLSAARAARKLQANLIHIHEDVRTIAAVRILNPGVPIVLHTNRDDIAERSMAKWVKRCKLVLTSSKHLRDRIRAAHPQFADRITTVYNGVDTALFRPVPVERGARSVSAPSAKLRREAREANVIDQTVFATIVPMPDSRKARLSQTILYVGDFRQNLAFTRSSTPSAKLHPMCHKQCLSLSSKQRSVATTRSKLKLRFHAT